MIILKIHKGSKNIISGFKSAFMNIKKYTFIVSSAYCQYLCVNIYVQSTTIP